MADELDLLAQQMALELKLQQFICSKFVPADNIGNAEITLTTSQFINLLNNNFSELEVETVSKVLDEIGFHEKYFDNELVWLINSKV